MKGSISRQTFWPNCWFLLDNTFEVYGLVLCDQVTATEFILVVFPIDIILLGIWIKKLHDLSFTIPHSALISNGYVCHCSYWGKIKIKKYICDFTPHPALEICLCEHT